MTVPSPSDGRVATAFPTSDSTSSPPNEPLLIAPPKVHRPGSRDPSQTRGRALSATSPSNASPRGITPTTSGRPKPAFEVGGGIERKVSQSYGKHHRQTSIVHGGLHSRNHSLLASTGVSPISPQRVMLPSTPDGQIQNGGTPVQKSPSLSTLNNGFPDSLSVNRSFDSSSSHRQPERKYSGRVKRTPEHQRSQSKAQANPPQEPKTVGEYALHHLFTSFIAEADDRIERCMPIPGQLEPRIETVCGPGADASFDQLISSLAHINRHKPNSLIDPVIQWRRNKADRANSMMSELQELRESNSLTIRLMANGSASAPVSPPAEKEVHLMDYNVKMAERRSTISIYLLCRVLIEIINHTTLAALNGPDGNSNTAARLEDVIYSQLQSVDPDSLGNPLRQANWIIRGQLLGVMSSLRFDEVAERFTRDLDVAQKKLSIKGMADPKLAQKTAMLVQSMRSLTIKLQPEDAWDRSCEFLQLLARYFAEVHGRAMKHAYAELFEQLLLPIAGSATSELNSSRWKDVLAIVSPKISQMMSKADHWPYVFPLQTVLLCVSPADQFATQWLQAATSFLPKTRDRSSRSHALKAICRLVWRYLYHHNESSNAIARKLDEIVKLVFQGGKRVLVSTDPLIADPLIQLIRVIGYKQQELCFRTIILPLMNSELFSGPDSQLKIENLDPEKTVIAIRAFLAVLADLEKGEAPPFPTVFECDALIDPSSRSPITHRRTKSQGFAVSAGRTERLSQPVMTTNMSDVAKDYYLKFCKILGQLTIICDNTFGGQAVLDEKLATHTPKTPMAEAFNFKPREDITNPNDLRQHYYDLLHVAVEALPRCLSPHLPINSIVNLLCTGTAHVQPHIASSSAQSLKSIARQSHAQQVTIGFARFIFNFDDRYATVSDGSLLGPGHIESTLTLYVELLQIWIEDIQSRTRKAVTELNNEDQSTRELPLDLSGILAHVDEVESHGLFFLCSSSRAVRAIAVNVLRLITKFDTALGKPTTRIISILEESPEDVININDDRLTVAERSRLQKGQRKSNANSTLGDLCSSDVAHDANLWFKVFPNLVHKSSQTCLHAVALTRELVCQRLSHSYRAMHALAQNNKQNSYGVLELGIPSSKLGGRFNGSSPEIAIEQWKIHLIFACTTVTNIGASHTHLPKSSQSSLHIRKTSKSSSSSQEKIASAAELFSKAVPFLQVPNAAVRNAAVLGLGATNTTLFQTLLEALQPSVADCIGDAKERLASHQRNASTTQRSRRIDNLRTEITHLLSLTCRHLQDQSALDSDYVLEYLIDYTRNLRLFLSDTEIQDELDCQKLRMHFCALTESLYECTRNLKDPSKSMSFQARQAAFALMENWCGFSPNEAQLMRRDEHIRRSILDHEQDVRRAGIINSAFEKQKNELQLAALSAMAALCAGPLNFVADNKILMHFDVRRLFSWINAIFESPSDRTQGIGRRALQNLIVHNLDQPFLMAQMMRMCYVARKPKALTSYFEVVTNVLTEDTSTSTPIWKTLCVCLYTLGNEDSQIRTKSNRLLRTLEERQGKTSKIQDLEISVSDKTTAVYKLAQFEISRILSKQHPELALHVFSEFSAYFNELEPDHQRNMVSAMLPWIQTIELQLDMVGGPTAASFMLLVNLFEITVKSSVTLHNEVQALWQALATGPYGGNVQLVLDFIITICLDKREQNFVLYSKQIVVFLSKTPAGARVVEYLLLQISPKTIVPEHRAAMQAPLDTTSLPYVADMTHVLPTGAKQNGLSLGQLCMILLVDLVVSPFTLPADKLTALLQVVLVQWDQYVPIVQEQAREMLVHLIHELVISKIVPGRTEPDKKSIEDFIESIRRNDPKIAWSYADSDIRAGEEDSRAVSEPMAYVVDEVVKIFSVTYPGIREPWGKVTMTWATSCAVRHVACRSFQVFRCISMTLDKQMLADMLARLSNTIADDENHDYLIFSLEILTTLRSIIGALEPLDLLHYPQLFWTTCACLDTIFEREFREGLSMLTMLLTKMDLSDPAVLKILNDARPTKWEGPFNGLHALIYKGMRSSQSMEHSLAIMEKLIRLPSSDIVGHDDRLLFTLLANIPRYLHHFEIDGGDPTCLESAETLAYVAEGQKHTTLGRILHGFAESKFRDQKSFLSSCNRAIQTAFFPAEEFRSLVFLLGLVNNQCAWFKVKTMQALCVMIPDLDMRKPEIATQGPDLISPLLRLLQTEHCQQALAVLDNVIDMTGTPLDNKHLRMSMAGSHSSRAVRKEYDSTKSLYGIPEESGWSIPMPAIHSLQTRNNVHAVFYTLTFPDIDGSEEPSTTPEIEFSKDEYQDSYFADRTATMMSDDTRVDVNMGELVMKLDSLDDFFDEQADNVSPLDSNDMPKYPSGMIEERENLYDQQALPILHRSLQRNPSITSFQTGFAETRYPPLREPSVMNPTAFTQNGNLTARPGMHNRSITSPIMTTKAKSQAQNDIMSGDEAGDDLDSFSDDERSLGRSQSTEEAHQMQNTVKPAGFKAGFRQGLRRLTSSSGSREARDAVRGMPAKSPKVPKVPLNYLRDPMSAEP